MLHCWQVQLWLTHTRFIGHTLAHAPQLLLSVPMLTSQPFAAFLSQSAKPWLQPVIAQVPFKHDTIALAAPVHSLPHAPQFFGSLATEVSQPSFSSLLQSSKPKLQDL